ncbi:MAG: hypothetical protein K2Y39_01230 [Candidatus Obscuribacterales bacterium]|nr:hypothetical protein [Candidatus Obscuribacterales bacterium]
MQRKIPPSLIAGLTLLLIAVASIILYTFNYNLLAPLVWIFLPAGLVTLAVGSIAICVNSKLAPRRFPIGGLFLGAIACSLFGAFLLPLFLSLTTTVFPVVALLGQTVSCIFLVRSLKSRRCMLLLISSLGLAIAIGIQAFIVSFAKGAAPMKMLQNPIFWLWLGCAITATFDSGQENLVESTEPDSPTASSIGYARYLWIVGAMIWIILLTFAEGAAENLKP